MSSKDYREILRSSSVIGGASVVNVFVGLVRTKLVAILLGPAGIGLIGLLQNLMVMASTISAMGLGKAGTRQIAGAAERKDQNEVWTAQRSLFWVTLLLSLLGAALVWLTRDIVAARVLGNSQLAQTVGWLSLGVALTVASGSQIALLNGLRRIPDIARVSIVSTLLAAILGLLCVWRWRESGILPFILSLPIANFVVGHYYVSRIPRPEGLTSRISALYPQWRTMLRIGSPFMVAGLAITVGQLVVRSLVHSRLGADALGHFQAAWMISMTYIGFVLHAMGTDFFPKLSGVIEDSARANRLVNQQSEVALLLAAPAFLLLLGLAPWAIQLLYTDDFGGAVAILRWQVLGDVLKVASWPLGFVILAAGDGRTFMLTESSAIAVFAGLVWLGLPSMGIEVTGIAFLIMYLVYLPTVYFLAKRRTSFSWHPRFRKQFVAVVISAIVVFAAASFSQWLGAIFAILSSFAIGVYAIARLGRMTETEGRLGRISGSCRAVLRMFGVGVD